MSHREEAHFRATSGSFQGFGATPQDALAAIMLCLPSNTPQPIVIWPYNQGDAFFTDSQQVRLKDLKGRQGTLTPEERSELDGLIAAALDATVTRTRTLPVMKS